MLNGIIRYFLENKLVTYMVLVGLVLWGISTAPFNWKSEWFPRDPVPVDAIPDIGENQQIVFTEWMGQSPQDVEDQVTYPLTTALLGIPGVKTIRSSSIFGLSSIYVIFEEDVDFYWSRTRILEKLNSLPQGTLPADVSPALGPDATGLGQIYWYTLEGRDENGNPAGGWEPHELRSIQDYYVRYQLTAASGVSEVASIGGYEKEYQIDVDPVAMSAYNVNIHQIATAIQKSNLDIGAKTVEINRVEYLVRVLGYIEDLDDISETVVVVRDNVPIRIKDVAHVHYGPAIRRGGLDKGGTDAVGGVVVARYGSNPLEVIQNVKAKINELAPGLPEKTLDDGRTSKVTIVPFYDRSTLIKETLGTLESALSHEILISILVIVVLMMNLRVSFLVSSILPVGVLMAFIAMRYTGVDANIVALSGIAIAIGVMVDVGIVFTENIVQHLDRDARDNMSKEELLEIVYNGATEVAPAVVTALMTTTVSFFPVFAMEAAEGKLFHPLAFTKTFALLSALLIGILMIPSLAHSVFSFQRTSGLHLKTGWNIALVVAGIILMFVFKSLLAVVLIVMGAINLLKMLWVERYPNLAKRLNIILTIFILSYYLTVEWMPLGVHNSAFSNWLFVVFIIGLILLLLFGVIRAYPLILGWCLRNKWKFLAFPMATVLFGIMVWIGFDNNYGFVAEGGELVGLELRKSSFWESMDEAFPGTGKEFMPALDEGSFLLMPTTMAHSGIEENMEQIGELDKHLNSVPEIETVVGKWGRVNSALDPAPVSMYENIINYKPEYILDEDGHRKRFKVDKEGNFLLKDGSTFDHEKDDLVGFNTSDLIEDAKFGKNFRQWRDHISTSDDIWDEVIKHSKFPGLTSAPKLQPIQTRLVMLQTGMRAPMGIKVYGPDLETIEAFGKELEVLLKQVPSIEASTVFADRVVGKPYLEIDLNRKSLARYGISIADLQMSLAVAIGGKSLTRTVEGRERYSVRVRYAREFRDNPNELKEILIPTKTGVNIPLGDLAEIKYTRGPQMIKSENTFLMSYVIFDKKGLKAEVDVVEEAQAFIDEKIDEGKLEVPAGVSYKFTGNYENQIRATKRLLIVVPISLVVIFLILYFQFRSVITTFLIFSGIVVAFSGGFILIWFYGQDWFMNFSIADINIRELFQMKTINLSVAVWVGFIALFGIATDDGVLMGTYLKQTFDKDQPKTKEDVRKAVLHAGSKRIRPAIITTATTIIALIPVLTSTGKGSDIMVPMAIPSFGGMLIAIMTMFVVPVLYSMWKESEIKSKPEE